MTRSIVKLCLLFFLFSLLLSPKNLQATSPVNTAKTAGSFEDAIADSVADFSGVQGAHGWSYGYMAANGFKPFPQFQKGTWRQTSLETPHLTQMSQEAGKSGEVVRRWRSSRTGSVRLVGSMQGLGKEKTICRVLVKGTEQWSRTLLLGDTLPHHFDVLLYDIPAGSFVDVVSSGGTLLWKAQILEEPCTAWRPDLSSGPRFSEAEKITQRKQGTDILAQLNGLANKTDKIFTIPSGDYRFSGDAGAYPHIKNLNNVKIKAYGVTFWFDPPLIHGLQFENCRNVTVEGITLDCDPLPFFQARVVSIDTKTGTVTGELMPGYEPAESSGNRTVSYYRPDGNYIRNGIIGCSWSRRADSNLVEIKAPAPGVSVGDYLACVIRTGQQLRTVDCSGMVYRDINLYAGGGMAVLEDGGPGGSLYQRVRATRRPGTNRLHAFGADGFHISTVAKGPILDRCEAAYLADDEVNLHGRFGEVIKQLAPDQYLLFGVPNAYQEGQRLDFWGFVEMEPLGTAKVKKAYWSETDNAWNITLHKALELPVKTLIDTHRQTTGGYVIKNCWFHDTGQRFLINGSPNGIVKNNTFQNTGGYIAITNESWAGYTEGAFPSNTIFKGNRIINQAGGFFIGLNPGGRPGRGIRRSMPIKNIAVTGNYFEGNGLVMDISQVQGLHIQDNLFDQPFAAENWQGFGLVDEAFGDVLRAPIRVAAVRDAIICGNRSFDPDKRAEGRIVTTGPLTANIVINGVPAWNTGADSLSSWYPEVQGGRGWSFGALDTALVKGKKYTVESFRPFPIFEGGWKPASGSKQYPFIGKTTISPSTEQAAVRRWISNIQSKARIDIATQTPAKDTRATVSVFVDGEKKYQIDTSDHQPHRFSVPLQNIKVGSVVDFVVGSQSGAATGETILYAKILTLPNK